MYLVKVIALIVMLNRRCTFIASCCCLESFSEDIVAPHVEIFSASLRVHLHSSLLVRRRVIIIQCINAAGVVREVVGRVVDESGVENLLCYLFTAKR